MKIGYLSDLHLEFSPGLDAIYAIDTLNQSDCDLLVIAGDLESHKKEREFLLNSIEIPYVFVMGNHDFYKTEVYDDFFEDKESNICGATLWTSFGGDLDVEQASAGGIWDFRWIKNFTTDKCKNLFYKQRDKIFESPCEIVVTHFPPSTQAIEEKYKDDIFSRYFCNDLDLLIQNSNKKLWIFGHVHSDWDFMIGDCRCVSNPWGYPGEMNKEKGVRYIEV